MNILITKQAVPSPPTSFTSSLTTTATDYYNLPNAQLNRLQHIQNSLASAVVRVWGAKLSLINPALKSLHRLIIKQRRLKILSVTYNVFSTTHCYLYNSTSSQSQCSTSLFFRCRNLFSPTFLFLSEGQQSLFPSRITLSLAREAP